MYAIVRKARSRERIGSPRVSVKFFDSCRAALARTAFFPLYSCGIILAPLLLNLHSGGFTVEVFHAAFFSAAAVLDC